MSLILRSNAKKAKRAEAYELMVDLKTKRRELTEEDIDSLLLYFAPSVPKTAKTSEEWCAKAVAGDKEMRVYLRYLRVDNGRMVGCDGVRLHVAKTDKEDGFYCPKTFARVEGDLGRYPDVDRILSTRKDDAGSVPVSDLVPVLARPKNGKPIKGLAVLDGAGFNERFLLDAVNNDTSEEVCIAPGLGGGYQAFGHNRFGEWLVMPMRY